MSPLIGISLKLASLFFFVIMAALIKAASENVPTGEAVFFRSFFAIPVIFAWMAMRGDLAAGVSVARPWMHVIRGIVGTGGMAFNFAALGLLPLPEVTTLGYLAPLITVILAAVLLGERVRIFRLSAVGVGLFGVLIVLWPRLSLGGSIEQGAMLGVICVICSAFCASLAQIQIRRMVATERTASIVFYFSLTAAGLGLATLPFGWVMPTPHEAMLLIAAGVVGGAGQICVTSAYRGAEAALLAPFEYASILFAIIIGYAAFGEVPTGSMLLGSAVVIASGVVIIWRERKLGLKRPKARSKMTPQG